MYRLTIAKKIQITTVTLMQAKPFQHKTRTVYKTLKYHQNHTIEENRREPTNREISIEICLQWKGANYSILLGQYAPLLGACGGLEGTG